MDLTPTQKIIEAFLQEFGYALDETDISSVFDTLTDEEKVEVKESLLKYLSDYLPVG